MPKLLVTYGTKWTKHELRIVVAKFEFDDAYLHDDVAALLFILESTEVKIDVWTYVTSYKLKTAKEWWGVNKLRLACPPNPKETVMIITTNPGSIICVNCNKRHGHNYVCIYGYDLGCCFRFDLEICIDGYNPGYLIILDLVISYLGPCSS